MIRTCSLFAAALFAGGAFAQNVTHAAAPEASHASSPPSAIDPLVPSKPPAAAVGKPFVYTPKPGDVTYGKGGAPVTVVEYASLSCPHCAHFYMDALPELKAKYIDTGKVKLVYRNFPLNDPALKAAELVQCADPDRRPAFIKVLFTTQTKWAYDSNWRDELSNIAALGGIDRETFERCMKDKKVEKTVGAVAKEASDDYKIHSTPTFFINGKQHEGAHDAASLGKDIDAALAKANK